MVYNLVLHKKARENLDYTRLYEKKDFWFLIEALSELEQYGLNTNAIKDIGDSIFRKRVGRRRILFQIELKNIDVWIIAIEKDTQKDYKLWKQYILSNQ